MKASQLVSVLYQKRIVGDLSQVEVKDLCLDSRQVKPGTCFFCLPGFERDGHDFALAAQAAGASLLIASKELPAEIHVPVVYVSSVSKAMAILAKAFYHDPSKDLTMIGITGTNGKTTTAYIVDYLLGGQEAGNGLLGTIGHRLGTSHYPTPNTTTEVLTLNQRLSQLLEQGGKLCTMEVSSHALELGRTWGVDFDVAVFTNLTHEHLELHKTMERYGWIKTLLFAQMGNQSKHGKPKLAILNGDDPLCDQLKLACPVETMTYGFRSDNDLWAEDLQTQGLYTQFTLHLLGQTYPVSLPLLGDYNVMNAMAAIAVAYSQGLDMDHILAKLQTFPGVPGRMQTVDLGQDFKVLIDYAHTPDGLENLFSTLKKMPHRKIILVNSHSGGNRDSSMRPEIGRLSFEFADFVVLTSDNSRNEPLNQIHDGLLSFSPVRPDNVISIEDRAEAVDYAIQMAQTGDLVVLAGKGHETYQIIGETKIAYSELEAAQKAIQRKMEAVND